MAELECKDVTLGYEDRTLVEHLNFEVNTGDYLCIVGENGTGKSTLMRTILRLQKPLVGSIEYGDGLRPTEIGYLPQQTIVQKDFPASVREVVMSGCQTKAGRRPFYTKDEKKLAEVQMERLGIMKLSKHCYRELSGGQQQRVLLARALCATEKMLLLDEPVSGLDPKVTAEMYKLIQMLNEQGISIIMISHDISSAVKYASHILHIGDHVFFGTVQEYQTSSIGRRYLEEA
ncbi:MAG: ABC transporter ATP-binding protein [Lachnospiraceae bacterium]|nr:ABC transporter ATP-binding protein [Lachnospiraceae bacterium]